MAGAPIDLPERDSFGGRSRRIKRDRTGNERQLQIALPVRARRRQQILQRNKDTLMNLVGDSRESTAWNSALVASCFSVPNSRSLTGMPVRNTSTIEHSEKDLPRFSNDAYPPLIPTHNWAKRI